MPTFLGVVALACLPAFVTTNKQLINAAGFQPYNRWIQKPQTVFDDEHADDANGQRIGHDGMMME